MFQEAAYLGTNADIISVEQNGVVSKVTVKIPEDGSYELSVFEKDDKGGVEVKKRYHIIHEGKTIHDFC